MQTSPCLPAPHLEVILGSGGVRAPTQSLNRHTGVCACLCVFESSLFPALLTSPSSLMPPFLSVRLSERGELREALELSETRRLKTSERSEMEVTGHGRADRNLRQRGWNTKIHPHQSGNAPDGWLNMSLVVGRCSLWGPLPR